MFYTSRDVCSLLDDLVPIKSPVNKQRDDFNEPFVRATSVFVQHVAVAFCGRDCNVVVVIVDE